MKNKTIFLITMLILLSGCGAPEENAAPTAPTGILTFGYTLLPQTIRQGDVSVLTMSLGNYYNNSLNNVEVRFEPTFSGVTFSPNGPLTIESGNTGTWVVDIKSAAGAIAKDYIFKPIICFDYAHENIGFFRVAPEEPSTKMVDYSASTYGPIIIDFANFRGINAKTDYGSIDMTITYRFADNYQGLTNYTTLDNQNLTAGEFIVESKDLSLRALQGSARLSPGSIPNPTTNYCQKLGSGISRCTFQTSYAKVVANSQFGFRIVTGSTLTSEIETYFKHALSYRICLKPASDFTLSVVKAQ